MELVDKKILLFDGVCNLCTGAVQFVLKRNMKENIFFASLQSDIGQQLLEQFSQDKTTISSLVFIENNKAYTKSSGALRMTKQLKRLWPICYGFMIIPKFIRDFVYDFIAKHRYKWFGKKEACWVPPVELRKRFLDS